MLLVKIMGCICSKGGSEKGTPSHYEKSNELNKASVHNLVNPSGQKRDNFFIDIAGGTAGIGAGEVQRLSRTVSRASSTQRKPKPDSETPRKIASERPARALSSVIVGGPKTASKVAAADDTADGWPAWLTSVAGDAIRGLVPRRADSFEKLDKIGQGTYSSVYKARDLETGKIVALKKVRFVNMDPESVRFMAREIHILRRLDHPNVMKLEGLVTSRMSRNLYLVFEYMEHDLAGIAATPGIKFTQAQIKCYMQQLLRGLEHCHARGVLHRDIKGSNILIDNNGVLKIADFGLATFYDKNQPMTSRVVTLWYRPPELLLGSTHYGPAVDLWSAGCILAELFAGKPIMPGRTEVEQMHKIFKLCGSPSEGYWQRTKLPHATSFKPQQPYKRCVTELFKDFPSTALALVDRLLTIDPERRGSAVSALRSSFFSTEPLPCDPSSLPKYAPSKEFDVKLRNEEARRRKADNVKGRGPESVRRGSRDNKENPTPEFTDQEDNSMPKQSNTKTSSHKYSPQEESGSGFRIEPPRGARTNGYAHSTSMVHPIIAIGPTRHKTTSETNTRIRPELRTQRSHVARPRAESYVSSSSKKDDNASAKDSSMGYVPKKNRIHYSGPLVPAGGNIDDMLKEHERQIQQAVRKARLDKARSRTNRVYN